jgi:hypothetical protein
MTLTAAIIANVIADVALIGGLTYLMSRASRLTPHVAATTEPALAAVRVEHRSASGRSTRSNSGLVPAYSHQSE